MLNKFFKPAFAFVLLFFSFQVNAQSYDFYNYEYNQNFDDSIQNLNLLDSSVKNKRIYFTGENHNYISANINIELSMLKYLNQNEGVRNLMIELGYSRGYILNKYINDDSTYYNLLSEITNFQYNQFIKELRKYNQTLPDSMRITVHGVDIERFPKESFVLLSDLLPNDSVLVPADIDFYCEVLKVYGNYSKTYQINNDYYGYREISYRNNKFFFDQKTLDSLVSEFERKKPSFKAYLGEKYDLFEFVFETIKENQQYFSYNNMPHQSVFRERIIKRNIQNLLTKDSSTKFYGQFGRCHISTNNDVKDCEWYGQSSVALRLINDGYKSQTLTIPIYYDKQFRDYYYSRNFDVFDNETQHVLEMYKKNLECDAIYLLKVKDEDTILSKKYDYFIFNNTCSNSYYEDEKLRAYAVGFDFLVGQSQYKFDNLNNGLFTAGQNQFRNGMNYFNFGIMILDYGVYNTFSGGIMQKQVVKNGQFTHTLSGFNINESYGYSINIGKTLTISPYINFKYSQLKLKVQNDSNAFVFSPGFSQIKEVKYNNNALLFGFGLDIRCLIVGPLGITVRSQYSFDLSSKHWKLNQGFSNKVDSNSPKTALNGLDISAGLSLYIFD